ncbi:MAG TPA: thymidine kinase [Candidatus Microsaccharimonas sp.]|jgi:thymidine kinase
MSKLHFKYGAMNSGKSDTLIKAAYNYTERGHDIITVKPGIDSKGGEDIVARAGGRVAVNILALPEMNIREEIHAYIAQQALKDLECVLVDEAQFLTPIQVDQLFEVAKFDDTSVIAYGLRTDFQTSLFPGSARLLEVADNIEKLPTMCRCKNQAEFNCRRIGNSYVFDGEQIAIDGEEAVTYDSLCGTCYLEEKAKQLAA